MTFALPTVANPKDASMALSAILAAVASGELTPSEAAEIGKLIDGYVKAVEANELAERLAALERRMPA